MRVTWRPHPRTSQDARPPSKQFRLRQRLIKVPVSAPAERAASESMCSNSRLLRISPISVSFAGRRRHRSCRQGEPGGDRVPVLAESFGEAAQLADGLSSARAAQAGRFSPVRWQSMPANSRTRARAAASSSQRAVIVASAARSLPDSLPGGGEDPPGHGLRLGGWGWCGEGGVLAQPGSMTAQCPEASAVAAGRVSPGAASRCCAAFFPPLRAEYAPNSPTL
jgi:hypothetical protein